MTNQPDTYEQAITSLIDNNIYPSKVAENGECEELEVYCMAILMDEEVEEIKSILGDGWEVDKLSNIECITIKKSNQK